MRHERISYLPYTTNPMNTSNLVNYSRDGDQFHYLWAARRCLGLLSTQSDLVAISIEGVSNSEGGTRESISTGEDVIDVAEYYGSEILNSASSIHYCQLKHSTVQLDTPWPLSKLKITLRGFANKYSSATDVIGKNIASKRLRFRIVTNRPISQRVKDVVAFAQGQRSKCNQSDYRNLETHTRLSGNDLRDFCGTLTLEDSHEDFWEQRNILASDISGYLAQPDADGPVRLKELVTRKATSDGLKDSTITREDVLRALNTNEKELFPAEMEIETLESPITRAQDDNLVSQIVHSTNHPVIVHAEGGVGKSIFASRLPDLLPSGSKCIVYDCFGNGQYRSPSRYRHRHKDALVQITNELARFTICHPLIPTPYADSSSYLKAFIFRLQQAINLLQSNNSQAILCIVVDAADNAQMAAEEIGETNSFVRDLLRENLPEGVRIVMFCRTHRIDLLRPPLATLTLQLDPFTLEETASHLRSKFADATEQDVNEFHRLSSQNPRVQATAFGLGATLSSVLLELGPNPTSVDDTLNKLLESAIETIRDGSGQNEKADIDRICQGLSVLRPLIPISVISKMSGVSEAAIKSFVLDIGRPLKLLGETIRFFDEPAETWFREKFRPSNEKFSEFVDTLAPLAKESAYVASTLPQLMLEAGQFDELVSLALSSERLPSNSPIEKRDVELQRLQFALKASLRSRSYHSAAKLAQKAGGETAGNNRQEGLFQANTDLVGVLLSADRVEDIVARRPFNGNWMGCHHVYEAGMMSCISELHADARSSMRMANHWLSSWSRLPPEEREKENVDTADIAELALAELNIHGPERCARSLRSWSPPDISYRAGRIVANRLVDQTRYTELNKLSTANRCDLGFLLAIIVELAAVFRHPPPCAVQRALRLVGDRRVKLKSRRCFDSRETVLETVTILAEQAHRLSVADETTIAAVIKRQLPDQPPPSITSRHLPSSAPLIRAYTVHAELVGRTLQLEDLATPEVRKQLEKPSGHHSSREVTEFNETVGRLLPWYKLRAITALRQPKQSEFQAKLTSAAKSSSEAAQMTRWDQRVQTNKVAVTWLDTVLLMRNCEIDFLSEYLDWVNNLSPQLSIITYTYIARTLARLEGYEHLALKYAKFAFSVANAERADVDSKIDSYIQLSRTLLPISKHDANFYFDQAIEVAAKTGDENRDRWTALLDLADCASRSHSNEPELAYRLSRYAELTYEYVERDKHFDWDATIRAIAGLSPPSVFAIMSRWRDRDFGRQEKLLPAAVHYLLERKLIDPIGAASLVAIRARWNYPVILEQAIRSTEDSRLRTRVTDSVLRYMELEGQSEDTWEKTNVVLKQHQQSRGKLDSRVAHNSEKPCIENETDGGISINDEVEDKINWSEIFSNLGTSLPDDLTQAYRKFREGEPPIYSSMFFREAINRVDIGDEPDFINAIAEMPKFNLSDLRELLDEIPQSWRGRAAIEGSLRTLIKKVCRRYCTDARRSRYYQTIPSTAVCTTAGISESELIHEILEAIAESSERLDAGKLFSLTGLLVVVLSESQAQDALSYGLTLVEPDLDESDGDGPWSNLLIPPNSVEGSVAGYVWATLASPVTKLRWEGAHAVRALVIYQRRQILDHLNSFACSRSGGTFVDATLFFYELHAIQWLLIGLSRGAVDAPELVAIFKDSLLQYSDPSEHHVVIRMFSASALITLAESSDIILDADEQMRLNAANSPTVPTIAMSPYDQRIVRKKHQNNQRESRRFMFGYDVSRYIFERLGKPFALSGSDIEILAEEVIRDDWQLDEDGKPTNDERAKRDILGDSLQTPSWGSYPKADDLSFYLSYHAMLVVAGKLLESSPLYNDPTYEDDNFQPWLQNHALSRSDSKWLSDRLDPRPLHLALRQNDEMVDSDWRWSIKKDDFENHIGLNTNALVVWGDWDTNQDRREESIRVASALVSRRDSISLLRALQTAKNPHDYCIPSVSDDCEIDSRELKLQGWVQTEGHALGIDHRDPWAADIKYPPLQPASYICELLALVPDAESREWRMLESDESGPDVSSIIWSQVDRDERDSSLEQGQQLMVGRTCCKKLLTEVGMDLIIEVQIERRIRRMSYEQYDGNDLGYVPLYTKLFLLRQGGNVVTI